MCPTDANGEPLSVRHAAKRDFHCYASSSDETPTHDAVCPEGYAPTQTPQGPACGAEDSVPINRELAPDLDFFFPSCPEGTELHGTEFDEFC